MSRQADALGGSLAGRDGPERPTVEGGTLFVYIEDEQMYWTNPVLMRAEIAPGDFSARVLEKLSYSLPGAGRLSTSATAMIDVAARWGITLSIIERGERNTNGKPEWEQYPRVKGATGNY